MTLTYVAGCTDTSTSGYVLLFQYEQLYETELAGLSKDETDVGNTLSNSLKQLLI